MTFQTFAAALLCIASACAQTPFQNGSMDAAGEAGVPNGWYVPKQGPWTGAAMDTEGCHKGPGCARLSPSAGQSSNLMQYIDATPFRGHMVRFRGWVQTEGNARGQMWLRVDLPNQVMGFFDNMGDRPIRNAGQWTSYDIVGGVAADARNIGLGVMAFDGTVKFDEASLEIVGDLPKPAPVEPPRAISDLGLQNLLTFTELYGLVRYFHPSDEQTKADMDRIALEAVGRVEAAGTPEHLATVLREVFAPVAPALRVYASGSTSPPASSDLTASKPGLQSVRWKHHGLGLTTQSLYKSQRERSDAKPNAAAEVIEREFSRSNIKALVPLELFADAEGTLPRAAKVSTEAAAPLEHSAASRNTHIADVIIAWNVFRYFYPYFEVMKVDWNAVLPKALERAALDRDQFAFERTLQWMVAQLQDGHGNANYMSQSPRAVAPFLVDFIDNKYVITYVQPGKIDLKPGDEIVSVNGRPTAAVIAESEQFISGATPQWKRSKAVQQFSTGSLGTTVKAEVKPFGSSETRTVECAFDSPFPTGKVDTRPDAAITELKNGIWYVDLTRTNDKAVSEAMPKLEKASGIVFDIRGYPRVSPEWLTHITQKPLTSAQWHVPDTSRPGEVTFARGGEWDLQPKAPYLAAPRVFLTSGGAISYAESTMGIIEHYKLGEIVGSTTAGTNGNINILTLPGKYRVVFTGMKVLKHDGSQHHGIGIRPTIPAAPTQAGVAAGRDEVLERGLAVLTAAR